MASGAVTAGHADPRLSAALGLLETELEAARSALGAPGLAAAVVHDRDVIWSRGFGVSTLTTRTPMTPDTIFRVGSITKVFTTTMLMQLRDAGQVHLDDPVARYVPGFRVRSPFPGARPVTLLQLAAHTSGLPLEAPLGHFHTMSFPSGEAMASSMADVDLRSMPGTRFYYSNGGYAVLGHALERAAGVPYTEFVADRILKPLGMADSGFDVDRSIASRLATPYRPGRRDRQPVESFHPEIGGLVPSGHLYSSVLDMARFLSLQFREESAAENGVLAGNSIAEMRTPVWMSDDWQTGMGIGWGLGRLHDSLLVNKSGVTFGTVTDAAFIPDLKLGIAVFVNSVGHAPALTRLGLELLAPVVRRVQPPPERERESPLPDDAERYAGLYVWPEMELELEITLADGRLLAAVDQSGAEERTVLVPLGNDLYRVEGGPSSGEIASFELDEDGAVSRLILGPYALRRERSPLP